MTLCIIIRIIYIYIYDYKWNIFANFENTKIINVNGSKVS